MPRIIVLELDDQDYQHVRAAIEHREHLGSIPEGGGNADGRAIAEICRGWGESMGLLKWAEEDEAHTT